MRRRNITRTVVTLVTCLCVVTMFAGAATAQIVDIDSDLDSDIQEDGGGGGGALFVDGGEGSGGGAGSVDGDVGNQSLDVNLSGNGTLPGQDEANISVDCTLSPNAGPEACDVNQSTGGSEAPIPPEDGLPGGDQDTPLPANIDGDLDASGNDNGGTGFGELIVESEQGNATGNGSVEGDAGNTTLNVSLGGAGDIQGTGESASIECTISPDFGAESCDFPAPGDGGGGGGDDGGPNPLIADLDGDANGESHEHGGGGNGYANASADQGYLNGSGAADGNITNQSLTVELAGESAFQGTAFEGNLSCTLHPEAGPDSCDFGAPSGGGGEDVEPPEELQDVLDQIEDGGGEDVEPPEELQDVLDQLQGL